MYISSFPQSVVIPTERDERALIRGPILKRSVGMGNMRGRSDGRNLLRCSRPSFILLAKPMPRGCELSADRVRLRVTTLTIAWFSPRLTRVVTLLRMLEHRRNTPVLSDKFLIGIIRVVSEWALGLGLLVAYGLPKARRRVLPDACFSPQLTRVVTLLRMLEHIRNTPVLSDKFPISVIRVVSE